MSILTRRRRLREVFAKISMATLAFLLAALSPGIAGALAGAPVTINIGSSLDPSSITIEPGTSVTWVNNDSERHRMASQDGPERFDSGNLDPGQTFTMTFDLEGTYSYIDDRDDENTAYFGTIIVSAGAPSTPPPGGGGGGGPLTIDVGDRIYRPASVTVSAGTTITWRNIDDSPHTVTDRAGSFDSGIFDTGGTYTRTFDTPGTFQYFCTLHSDMVGTVSVTGADGGAPPPPAPTPPPTTPPPPPPPPPSTPGSVTIFDNGYTPASLTVAEGTTVTWTNTGAAPHTATDRSGRFDSGFMMTGDRFSQTFTTAGTYEYFCTIHPEMVATVTVTGAGGAPPPPPPPPPPTDPVPPPPAPVAPAPGGIEIVDNAFRPATREISVGTTLVWTNTGALPHTATDRAGRFDSGLLMSGDSYRRTFDSPGTYEYYCTLHPEMVGTIVVNSPDGAAPPPPPPATPAPAPAPGSGSSTGSGAATGSGDVEVVDNDYLPGTITVARGSTLTFANTGSLPHTVTERAGSFDSGLVMPGQSYRRTFSSAGTFDYFCTIHPEMTGTVVVTESGTPVGSASASGDGVVGGSADGTTTTTSITAPTTEDVRPARASVDVIDNDFDPNPLRVVPGTTVSFTNIGDLPHTVTADGFDSGIMSPGDVFEWTFEEAGTFDYVCTLHPGMAGTVIVEAGAEETELASAADTDDVATSLGAPASASSSPGNSVAFGVFMAAGLAVAGVGMAVGVGRFTKALDNGTIG